MSTATLNYAPPSPTAPATFKKQPGETVQFKGDLHYTVGEPGLKNLFTGRFKVTECTVFLTSHRLVATPLRRYFPWGPLVWLIIALCPRKIVFSIPLAELAAIKLDPAHKTTLVLQTTSGMEYTMVSPTLFNSQPKWVTAISSAVTQGNPGTSAQTSETAITFARG